MTVTWTEFHSFLLVQVHF